MAGFFDSILGDVGTHGGILGMLTGRSPGLSLAASIDPQRYQQELTQQQMAATYQSLLPLVGGDQNLARAAALNPAILQQIAPELNTAPKLQETGVDPFTGQKNFGFFRGGQNPSLTAAPIQQPSGAAPQQSSSQQMADFQKAAQSGVTGEDLYQHLPETARSITKAIIEGRQQISPMMMRPGSPMLPIIEAAHTIDPTLDMSNPAARQKAMIDAKSGTVAQSQRGLNQTIHHIVQKLIPAMDESGNTRFPAVNAVVNPVRREVLGQTNTTAFFPTALAVADEMSRAFKGNHMSDAQIQGWAQSLSPNMSPDQQRKAVGTLLGLLEGAASAAHEQRVQGIGPINDSKMGPMLHDEAIKELEIAKKWALGGSVGTQTQQPTSAPGMPQVGQVMKGHRFMGGDPANPASWQKVQ